MVRYHNRVFVVSATLTAILTVIAVTVFLATVYPGLFDGVWTLLSA